MSVINDLNDYNNEDDIFSKVNDNFSQKIFELNEIIKEKENIIIKFHTKINELTLKLERLKIENSKLRNKLILKEEINKNKFQYNKNTSTLLQAQRTQSFIIYKDNIKSKKYETNINDDDINQSKINPFQMEPFQIFDKDDKNYYNSINNIIFENISNLKRDLNKFQLVSNLIKIEHNSKNKKDNMMKENISNNIGKSETKIHSSKFFENCKKLISKEEYGKLIEIVKLSNLKKITKENTYLSIISLLENNYPELSNQFKLLFV